MRSTRSLILATAAAALAGGQRAPMLPHPSGPADADMLRVLTALQASKAEPAQTLTIEQARAQPMPGDAATTIAVSTGLLARMPVAHA